MNTTVECQVLFHQFVDFISQNKNVSIREIKAATPTNDIDSKVRQLEVSYESDSSISIKSPGKKAIPYDCRHLGFRDSETKAWKYFMDIVSGNTHSFNWGPAYEHKEDSRVRLKIKNYDAQWKLCDEICKRLKSFFEKEFGWNFPKGYKLYEYIALGPDGERRFKFRINNSKTASIDFSSEDNLSALEEVDLLSKVQKLSNDYKSDPELSDGVMDELVVALNVGQKKYGWSDKYVKEMAIV